jgi:hypothetical protein
MVVEDGFIDVSDVRLFIRKLIPDGEVWEGGNPVVILLH